MAILRVFLNVNLKSGHDGLTELAKQNGIKTKDLEAGDFLIFINCKRDKLKMYAANEVIAYLRLSEGRINMNTIRELPAVFNGKSINYSEALRIAVEKQLAEKGKVIRLI